MNHIFFNLGERTSFRFGRGGRKGGGWNVKKNSLISKTKSCWLISKKSKVIFAISIFFRNTWQPSELEEKILSSTFYIVLKYIHFRPSGHVGGGGGHVGGGEGHVGGGGGHLGGSVVHNKKIKLRLQERKSSKNF